MERELNAVQIDDKTYLIVKEITKNDKKYIYLSNIDNKEDILIRRLEDNKAVPLNNDKEFELACSLFIKETAN